MRAVLQEISVLLLPFKEHNHTINTSLSIQTFHLITKPRSLLVNNGDSIERRMRKQSISSSLRVKTLIVFFLSLLNITNGDPYVYAQICYASRIVELALNETSGKYEYFQASNWTLPQPENTSYFRECVCDNPIYHPPSVCPLDAGLCGIPLDLQEPIHCIKGEEAITMVVRNVSLLVTM